MLQKNADIESLRGVAILLVVVFHALVGLPREAPYIGELSLYNYLAESLIFIRMPLFAVISGFVYSLRPLQLDNVSKFLSGKSKRILIPFFVATFITIFLKVLFKSETAPSLDIPGLSRTLLSGHEHLWFLPSMLIIFFMVCAFEVMRLLRSITSLLILVVVTWFLSFYGNYLPYALKIYSPIDGAFYLLPYFLWGIAMNRFDVFKDAKIVYCGFFVACSGLLVHQLVLFEVINLPVNRQSLLSVLTGLSITLGLVGVSSRFNHPVLIFIGGYSFTIYLYHFISISLGKKLLEILGINSSFTTLIVTIVLGVIAPIVMFKYFASRNKVCSLMVGGR